MLNMYTSISVHILFILCIYFLYIVHTLYIHCFKAVGYCFKKCWFHRWTAEELRKVIALLCNLEFDAKDVDPEGGHGGCGGSQAV